MTSPISRTTDHVGRDRSAEVLVGIAVLLVSAFVIRDWSAQPASRYTLTVAAVDDHTLQLDRYEDYLGLDQAHFDGHVYSDKSPYQPLLAAAPYQLFRWAGGEPFPSSFEERRFEDGTHRGLWWVTLWSSVLPAVALAVVVRRMVARRRPELATRATLAIMAGTTILPFAGWLFGHLLGALCVTAAWHLLSRRGTEPPRRDVLLAGCLLGAGIGAEYPVAVIALVFLVDVALRRVWRNVAALCVGTALATVPLLVYNWVVFRDPFEVAYQGHLKSFQGEGALGVYNLEIPSMDEVTKTLVGNRGLLVLTPVVTLALVGAAIAIVRRTAIRRDAWVAVLSLAAMVVVSTGIDGYGGDSPGPRYLIPALPLLAVPLLEVWQRMPSLCAGAAAAGATVMLVASVTDPAVHTEHSQPLRVWLDHLVDGEFATNVLTGDRYGWLLVATTLLGVGVGVLAIRREREPSTAEPVSARGGPVDLVVDGLGDRVR